MNKEHATDSLRLFNQKAERLVTSRFVKQAEKNSGFQIRSAVGQPVEVFRYGPDQEAIDAFVLTFRFFIQDNEDSSFRNLSSLYALPEVPVSMRDSFTTARNTLNQYLESNTAFQINGKHLTRWDILDTFLYGWLSHAKSKVKRKRYESWMANPLLGPLLTNECIFILFQVMNLIMYVRGLNEELLKVIEST